MNCLAIESDGRLLVIDCGVMFSNEDLGVNVVHPGFEYLLERRHDIEAVVLTHAHEDHLSGLPFLLREIELPVYSGSYALALLKAKLGELNGSPGLMARPLHTLKEVSIGPFSILSFPMPHSIIQNTGLVIGTPAGRILHTGDFKLGMAGDGGQNAIKTLKQVSNPGIDLMLADSTGSEETDIAGEESDVAKTLSALFQQTEHRVFTAIFSSNITRLTAVIRAAVGSGRQIALCGRSVQNHFRLAKSTIGMDLAPNSIVSVEEAANLRRRDVAIIVSGTQGEGRSALNRISLGTHHLLRVEKGDRVILSSRFIPGNEVAISNMIDRLLQKGADVIHRRINPAIHVSGHGGKSEIRAAIEAVNPRCHLPVHGTYRHLVSGAKIAESLHIKQIAVAVNGQPVRVSKSGIEIDDASVPVRRVYMDRGGSVSSSIIKDRRLLAANGVLVVAFSISDAGIEVTARGVVSQELLPWFTDEVQKKTRTLFRAAEELFDEPEPQKEHIRSQLRKFITKLISREPLVIVTILP